MLALAALQAAALLTPTPPRRAVLSTGAAASGALLGAPARGSALPGMPDGVREVMTTVTLQPSGVEVSRRRFTGAGDPAWTYPQRDVSSAVFQRPWASAWPYSAESFVRLDERPDPEFYRAPKLVYHIDEGAVASLTRYYDASIPAGSDVLDICSSWVSHYPRDFPERMASIVGSGISEKELACNDQLGRYAAADLNAKPKLPFADRSFDALTCVVSFDYLTKPLQVMKECARVLRPGGKLILSQSNRCFYSKAVGVWTADMSDAAHLGVLGNYVHFSGGFDEPRALDISAKGPGTNDPMYIVEARRK